MFPNIKLPAILIIAANAAFASANTPDLNGMDLAPRSPKLDADAHALEPRHYGASQWHSHSHSHQSTVPVGPSKTGKHGKGGHHWKPTKGVTPQPSNSGYTHGHSSHKPSKSWTPSDKPSHSSGPSKSPEHPGEPTGETSVPVTSGGPSHGPSQSHDKPARPTKSKGDHDKPSNWPSASASARARLSKSDDTELYALYGQAAAVVCGLTSQMPGAEITACPLEAGVSGWDCLNLASTLESCGGCQSLGEGQDCTTIVGADSVGCVHGKCIIGSCEEGYYLDSDKGECIAD